MEGGLSSWVQAGRVHLQFPACAGASAAAGSAATCTRATCGKAIADRSARFVLTSGLSLALPLEPAGLAVRLCLLDRLLLVPAVFLGLQGWNGRIKDGDCW